MLFHVIAERQGPEHLDAHQTGPFIENVVLPTLKRLDELEKQGKIKSGGLLTGQRALAMQVEAASIEELDVLLESLPLWPFVKFDVTPLTPFAARLRSDSELVNRLKAVAR